MRNKALISWTITVAVVLMALIIGIPEVFARPPASEYVTPFGVTAPWNRTVTGIPRHPQSATYASKMWNTAPNTVGHITLRFIDYTYPVFYAEDATTTLTVSGGNATINGKKIPWNPAWTAAAGSDGQIIILDPATGREWDLWQARISGSTLTVSNGSLVGVDSSLPGGSVGNYHTKTNGWRPSRGVGIQYLMGLVRPEELTRGEIKHALSVPIRGSGNTFVPPATKTDGNTSGGIPEGMRFALDVTDSQIETWAATKPAAYQKLARIMGRALKDYGWFITDTSGGAGFQMEAVNSAEALWKAQGIDPRSSTAKELMSGLISQARIYALVDSTKYPPIDTEPPPGPTPCTSAEEAACTATFSSCMNACNQ